MALVSVRDKGMRSHPTLMKNLLSQFIERSHRKEPIHTHASIIMSILHNMIRFPSETSEYSDNKISCHIAIVTDGIIIDQLLRVTCPRSGIKCSLYNFPALQLSLC